MRLKDNGTPTAFFGYCNGKVCYDKKGALTVKNNRFRQDHIVLRLYECWQCKHWHLTSRSDLKEKPLLWQKKDKKGKKKYLLDDYKDDDMI